MLLVSLGSYVVLNIFLAIAVDSLEAMNETVEEIERETGKSSVWCCLVSGGN